eukprot:620372-Prorocentrum_lima.AAC.1
MGVKQLLRELLDPQVTNVIEASRSEVGLPLMLLQDNESCIRTLTTEVSSWRSRHYALKAAWIRDTIACQHIDVKYTPGKNIIADGLTK